MAEIPYYFDTPVPKYFREKGWLKKPKNCAFISWCFSRCSPFEREVEHDNQRIFLKPYQFIFGRIACCKETGLTEDEVRAQQFSMEKGGFLKKAPNKTPNRFTIYEWSTECFLKNNPQQNTQETPNKPPTNPHKLDVQNLRTKDISKDVSFRDCGNVHNFASLSTEISKSYEQSAQSSSSFSSIEEFSAPAVHSSNTQEILDIKTRMLENFTHHTGNKTDGPTLLSWIKKYDLDEIAAAMIYVKELHGKNGNIDNPIAYVTNSLKKGYAQTAKNRKFGKKKDEEQNERLRRNTDG